MASKPTSGEHRTLTTMDKNDRFEIRLPRAEKRAILAAAEEAGQNPSVWARRVLADALLLPNDLEVLDQRAIDIWMSDSEIVERFWTKVIKDGPLPQLRPELGPCWEWDASHRSGYGRFVPRYRFSVPAHRFAYELLVGRVPEGLVTDHLCRNRGCCNPAHLEPVTSRENTLRGESVTAKLARQTHCLNGHPLEGPNLGKTTNGSRQCLACKRERGRAARERSAEPDAAQQTEAETGEDARVSPARLAAPRRAQPVRRADVGPKPASASKPRPKATKRGKAS